MDGSPKHSIFPQETGAQVYVKQLSAILASEAKTVQFHQMLASVREGALTANADGYEQMTYMGWRTCCSVLSI